MVAWFAPPAAGRKPAATISLLYSNGVAAAAASKTYAAVSYGATDPRRKLLIFIFAGGSARTLTTFTASGVPVPRLFENSYFAVGIVDMPSGASGDIFVEWDGAKASFAIAAYRVTNLESDTPVAGGFVAFSSLVASTGLLVKAGGIVAGYLYGGGSSSRTVSWVGASEGFDAYIRTVAIDGYAEMHSGAAAAVAEGEAGRTVSATLSGDLADSKAAYFWSWR